MAPQELPIEYLGNPTYICGGGSLIIHIVALVISAVLSVYGVYALARHASSISKNGRLLLIASIAIALIPVTDLLTRWGIAPGENFWHAIHIITGVAGLYFTYRFAMVMDSKETENDRVVTLEVIVAILAAIAFYPLTEFFKTSYPTLFVLAYALLGIVLLWLIVLVFRILGKVKSEGSTFSLRYFSLSMIPLISLSILALALVQIPAEILVAVLKVSSLDPLMIVLLGAQISLYLVIAMLMAAFGYLATRISSFYGAIEKFVSGKKKKGRVAF
ncbi:Uncharacterised protein [uncultured archaeon]|nr:Uncharacterised protein [uncultured archaeon]